MGQFMKSGWIHGSLVAAALALAACGSDSKPTGPGIAGEAGSASLLIVAQVRGQEDIGSGQFSTAFVVNISDSAAQAVNDAAVTLYHATLGTIQLPWDSITPGQYSASANAYQAGTYTLNVRRGSDSLVNARVISPDLHVIVAPSAGDTLQQDQPFNVIWTRVAAAARVEVETLDYGPVLATDAGVADTGSYQVPASFVPRDDQRVRVYRSNQTQLTRGLPGSTFEAEIRNAVEPVRVQ